MKTSAIPLFCGVSLTVMTAVGLSHWWSVRQFMAAAHAGMPLPVAPLPVPDKAIPPAPTAPALAAKQSKPRATETAPAGTIAPASAQKDFYEALIAKIDGLQTQNRDLLDQVAETNRDLMKLEFRVDTHSESFRPLQVSEDRPFSKLENDVGVLPPRAEPVDLPSYE
jgi:hypothetical protein